MPFGRENDLCAVLGRSLDGLFGRSGSEQHSRALRHRSVGQVIPDFLYIRSDLTPEPNRIRGLSALEASVVAALLPGRPRRSGAIARQLYSRIERVAPRLRLLEKWGLLESVGDDAFCLRSELNWWSVHVVAVEAKLRRWREALHQAASYLRFANQSYVALPSAVVNGNWALAAEAAKARVGVVVVDEEGARVVEEAPVSATWSADRVWLLSRTVGLSTRATTPATNTALESVSRTRAANRADDLSLCVR